MTDSGLIDKSHQLPDFRLRQREYLLEISRAMTARLDLSSLLSLTLQSASEILSGQAGLITLRRDDEVLAPFASIGLSRQILHLFEPLWRDLEVKPGQKPTEIPDMSLRLALASRSAGITLRQVVALPLEIGDEVIGYIFIFRAHGAAFSDNDKQVLGAFANQAAISVQNARLYQVVSAERERLNAIIENSGDGVMMINPYRIIQTWNRTLAQLTGISADEALGRPCYEVLNLKTDQGVSVCHTSCPLIRRPADGRLYAEGIHERSDGMAINFADHYSLQTNRDNEVTQIIANVRDVTHFRKAEQLQQTLLSVISHELKTPVSIIKGWADTLGREDANWDKETLQEGLTVIEEEADRLNRLITNFLEASQLQAGGLKLRLSYLDLVGLIRNAVERIRATTLNHTIVLQFPKNCPSVLGDAERLHEVTTNLLSNAIKYSPDGGEIKVVIQQTRDNFVQFSIQDNGIGIAPADQAHIFERFYRVDNRLTRETSGTGLGLFLVKSVVEAHGGHIEVKSTPGQGSQFIVELPINSDEQRLLSQPTE